MSAGLDTGWGCVDPSTGPASCNATLTFVTAGRNQRAGGYREVGVSLAMNLRSVLVPLDGSELAAAALPLARILALSTAAEVTLATILPADARPCVTRGPADYLREMAAPLRAAGVVAYTTIRFGEPAAAPLARTSGAKLILVRVGLRSKAIAPTRSAR
jgi:hypothetical protein